MDPGKAFVTPNGEIIGTHQGIIDGLEESIVDEEVASKLPFLFVILHFGL